MLHNTSSTAVARHFQVNDLVLVYFPRSSFTGNTKFISSWTGPWRVHEILGDVTYLLEPKDGVHQRRSVVHVDRIKPFLGENPFKQGREPVEISSEPEKSSTDDQPAISIGNPTYAQVASRTPSVVSTPNGAASPALTRLQARQASRTVPEYPRVPAKPIEYQ